MCIEVYWSYLRISKQEYQMNTTSIMSCEFMINKIANLPQVIEYVMVSRFTTMTLSEASC